MLERLEDWFRGVRGSLSDWYDEVKKIWGNFVDWCADAPVVVVVLLGSTTLLLAWLFVVGYFPNPKPLVRGTGVFLQLFGFIIAAYGLEKTLKEFGRTPSTSRILPWFRKLPSVFQTRRNESITLHGEPAKISTKAGTGEVRYDNLSLPERVERLEERIEELKENIQTRINEEVERLENKIEEEVEAVEQEVQDVREKVKEVNVGERALWMEWGGVSFFVYGVPLASFPSFFFPAYRVLIIPVVAGTLLGSLHWYAD